MVQPAKLHDYLSEHLSYEWAMLEGTYARVMAGIASSDTVTNNALIESFWLHVRVCHEFLTSGGNQNTVKANKYVQRHKPSTGTPADMVKRLNEQISHLSMQRVVDGKLDATDMGPARKWTWDSLTEFRDLLSTEYKESLRVPDGSSVILASSGTPSASSMPTAHSSLIGQTLPSQYAVPSLQDGPAGPPLDGSTRPRQGHESDN